MFEEYRITQPSLQSSKGRKQIYLIPLDGNKKICMTYARYLMCLKENRVLNKDEVVHHKDGDCTNDSLDNLEIVSRSEHPKIHNNNKIKYEEYEVSCPNCNKLFIFTRESQRRHKFRERELSIKGVKSSGPFCTIQCANKYHAKLRTKHY